MQLDGVKLGKMDLPNQAAADAAVAALQNTTYQVESRKSVFGAILRRPFTTSTLQQEASRNYASAPPEPAHRPTPLRRH